MLGATGMPDDVADLDSDGIVNELSPLALKRESRSFSDPKTRGDGRNGQPVIDMGAYEFGETGPQPCDSDLDYDTNANAGDLALLFAAFRRTCDYSTRRRGIEDCERLEASGFCDVRLERLSKSRAN
jgi:hypothetical protein